MRIALAGDTMLGRGVADRLATAPPTSLFADEVVAAGREADLFLLNLECAVSDRGEPWPDPAKPFFFRAPPVAVEALRHLGVDCVTLANNHALDYGVEALADTVRHLSAAGIAWVGAGDDLARARAPAVLERAGVRVGVVGVTDHPSDYAAGPGRPGVAYADLANGVPDWLPETIEGLDTDITLVFPHWGPNMTAGPVDHVRSAARAFLETGATLVAGHSAHVFHGVGDRVLYDLGDFLDDYAVHPRLRNDLGLLFLVTFEGPRPTRLEALPLALDYCHTRLATGARYAWVATRFREACAALGSEVTESAGRLVISPFPTAPGPGRPGAGPRARRRRWVGRRGR
ncbi:CapA family protein [Wenjunlia vitaminophila]|uniref:CapA family protein n=1 Tax=Wenjunlia vitaminophila TaxID=76728 RepID=UPI000365B358|nr:CapA family protein [Wenjunlia vitaminophila]